MPGSTAVAGQKNSHSGEPSQANENGTQQLMGHESCCVSKAPAKGNQPDVGIHTVPQTAQNLLLLMPTHIHPPTGLPRHLHKSLGNNIPSTETGKVVLNDFASGNFLQNYKAKISPASNQPRQDDPM